MVLARWRAAGLRQMLILSHSNDDERLTVTTDKQDRGKHSMRRGRSPPVPHSTPSKASSDSEDGDSTHQRLERLVRKGAGSARLPAYVTCVLACCSAMSPAPVMPCRRRLSPPSPAASCSCASFLLTGCWRNRRQ